MLAKYSKSKPPVFYYSCLRCIRHVCNNAQYLLNINCCAIYSCTLINQCVSVDCIVFPKFYAFKLMFDNVLHFNPSNTFCKPRTNAYVDIKQIRFIALFLPR